MKFITETINNSVKRVIEGDLNNGVDIKNQRNGFKPKEYVPFFCKETNHFAILVRETENKKVMEGYEYQKLQYNNNDKSDDVITDQLNNLVQNAQKLVAKIRANPHNSLTPNEVKEVIKVHNEFMKKESARFYRIIFNECFKRGEEEYARLLRDKGYDKQTIEELQYKEECKVILAIDLCSDVVNVNHKHFHVEKNVRAIWSDLEKAMFDEK